MTRYDATMTTAVHTYQTCVQCVHALSVRLKLDYCMYGFQSDCFHLLGGWLQASSHLKVGDSCQYTTTKSRRDIYSSALAVFFYGERINSYQRDAAQLTESCLYRKPMNYPPKKSRVSSPALRSCCWLCVLLPTAQAGPDILQPLFHSFKTLSLAAYTLSMQSWLFDWYFSRFSEDTI